MFERLAGKLLSRLLSKYFVSDNESPASSSSSSSSSLGVWSGYVSLESLELRKEVVNSYLKSKGLPFELLQCTLGRVEITVPWAKLGLSSPSSATDGVDDAVVVVVVVDGVHALFRTNYEFDDEALREAAIRQRRQELQDAQDFGKLSEKTMYSAGLSGFLQKRLAEGVLKDVLEKLHIHVRDVHVRLEDVQSDPMNPCAVGVTFESLHVQADDESTVSPTRDETPAVSGVIRKVAQLNHFAIYWNALDYGDGLPTELSVLQDTMVMQSSAVLAAALDRCIARRATSLSSPLRARPAQTTPNHSFLLLPLDVSWNAKLSTDPRNLEERPALETSLKIDQVSLQLRDYQCSQISILAASIKEHSFTTNYRKYRPKVSAKEDPRAWWRYAFRIVQMELYKGNMRWSWSRFSKRYGLRKRYCELYERERRYKIQRENPRSSIRKSVVKSLSVAESISTLPSQDSVSDFSSIAPGEGGGLSVDGTNGFEGKLELSEEEMDELTAMEDGTRGDLTVHDIVLFRALINARVAADRNASLSPPKTRLRRLMSSFVSDDIESEEEYERLLAYLEQARSTQESLVSTDKASLIAVSIHVMLDRGCISLFSPLRSTEDLNEHRRIQQRFLDLTIMKFHLGYSLFGNYESTKVRTSLEDFVGAEIRTNHSVYTIVSRLDPHLGQGTFENGSHSGTPQTSNVHSAARQDLATVDIQENPLDCSDCDVRLHASVQALEVLLLPEGEWYHKIKKLASSKRETRSLSSFWEDIGMVQVNSMTSRRAGLLAKANAAIFAHKNVDMDIFVRCPLLRISSGQETMLTIDLGQAHFLTERLAGVATGKLLISKMNRACGESPLDFEQNRDENEDRSCTAEPDSSSGGSTHSSSKLAPNPSSPQREVSDSFFLGGSVASVIGDNRMSTRSFYGNTPFADDQVIEDYPSKMNGSLHSSFYDEFRLEISNTCMFITGDGVRLPSLVDKLDAQVLIAKSVIPADHTLCRLRAQCAIQELSIRLSMESISCINDLIGSWVAAVKREEPSILFYQPSMSVRHGGMAMRLGLPAITDKDDLDLRERLSDASSMLDEAEFIDAIEADDADDTNGAWLDDNWIADAESVVDSDIRSVSQRKRGRRKTSMSSDVSSISDRSVGTRRLQMTNQYLSAENLAKLEELVAEEEDGDSDAESFQSALSLGGQAALAAEVEDHIHRAQEEVDVLKRSLAMEAKCADGTPFLIPEARRRAQARKGLRIHLKRAKAELKALRATHEDLIAQLEAADALHYDEQLGSDPTIVEGDHKAKGKSGNELNARAMAIVRARKQRSLSNADETFKHQLTSGLNRELLRASLIVSKVTVVLDGLDSVLFGSETSGTLPSLSFEFNTSQCAVGVISRGNESRLSASVDGLVASIIEGIDAKGVRQSQHLLLGGTMGPLLDFSREGYDAPVASAEDRVLVLSFDRQQKPVSGRMPPCMAQATKLRIHIGEVEVVAQERSIALLMEFMRDAKTAKELSRPANIANHLDQGHTTHLQRLCRTLVGGHVFDRFNRNRDSDKGQIEYIDLSCHLSSLRATFGARDNTIGSFLITEMGIRYLRGVTYDVYTTRSQFDVRCNNVQLFDLYHRTAGLELLGCRDPYNPVAQLRIRSQLVPLTQTGGWVVGGNSTPFLESIASDDLSWNVHVGAKLHSVFATFAPEGLGRIRRSLRGLIAVVSNGAENTAIAEASNLNGNLKIPSSSTDVSAERDLLPANAGDGTPIRWRLDFVAKKLSFLFPSARDVNEIDTSHPHLARSNALLSFSLHSWLQAAPRKVDSLFARSSFSDISLIRTSDDWPLLESTSITSEIILHQGSIVNSACRFCLTVPDTFSWLGKRSSSVGCQQDGLSSDETDFHDCKTVVSVSISPVRLNIAPQTASLLLAALTSFKELGNSDKKQVNRGDNHTDLAPSHNRHDCQYIKVSAESFEVKLLRESERSTSISFADPLASLVAVQLVGSASQHANGSKLTMEIDDLCLYDLSSSPGARVFGMDDIQEEDAAADVCGDLNDNSSSPPQIMVIHLTYSLQQKSSVNVNICLGRMQCLILPSFLRSLLTFKSDVGGFGAKIRSTHSNEKPPHAVEHSDSNLGVPYGLQQIGLSLRVIGFEILLPSRDLFSYIRSRSKESVSVVAFRWKPLLTGTLSSPYGSDSVDASLLHSLSRPQETRCVMMRANLKIEDFQVLRTNISRRPFPRSAAGGPHISPCSFIANPPAIGEQRVTNPFWFNTSYQVVAVSDRTIVPLETDQYEGKSTGAAGTPHVTQALNVDAGFVDILVYIQQSTGGMNDALRVTIRPILDMLKRKDDSEMGQDVDAPKSTETPSKLSLSLKSATTVCSLQSEGIQVTCVPGGATKLTESPIAKCELSRLKMGLVAIALPAFGSTGHVSAIERLRQAGLERFGVVEPTISGSPVSHMTLAGWIQTELSASYHNRRLVAWEPFVEPWVFSVRSGIDLVRAFRLPPTPCPGEPDLEQPNSSGFISSFVGEGMNEKAGERIRDIGRLLRSPFSPGAPVAGSDEAHIGDRAHMSASNVSYIMMKSVAPRVVASALYPIGRRANGYTPLEVQIQTSSLQCLPGTDPAKWLELFGYPPIASRAGKSEPAAIVCSISDSRPLNVNLTGALIENVLGFMGGDNKEPIHSTAPHMIRNFSGLTIRFQECLDTEQISRGELAKKTIMSAGSEIPLSLKRSLSQSCDPHGAYIFLELGSLEDTAGRINHSEFEVTNRSRSTTYFYKAAGKIPVDTVGVRKYALCHQFKRRSEHGVVSSASQDIGYIIVRVDLQGSTKVVSIESPLVLKNNTEIDLLCELRNHGGVSQLWRSLLPRSSTPMSSETIGMAKRKYISVPADLVSAASSAEATLSVCALAADSSIKHESDVPRKSGDQLVRVDVPPPFSEKSVARGLIRVFETSLNLPSSKTSGSDNLGAPVSLSTCAVRIGSVSLRDAPGSQSGSTNTLKQAAVPEQRMLFFRPPIVVRNHLPVRIAVQGRVKKPAGVLRRTSSTAFSIAERINRGEVVFDKQSEHTITSIAEWRDLGVLECGKSLSWTGATAAEEVEIRVKLLTDGGEASRKFREWSTSANVPSEISIDRMKKPGIAHTVDIGQMTVVDDANIRLQLSASLEFGSSTSNTDYKQREDVCWFSRTLPPAPRIVGVFVPFWIIDSAGQDLEFSSNTAIAGQSLRCSQESIPQLLSWKGNRQDNREHLGLAELLDDEDLSLLSVKASFEVLMIGDKKSSRLSMRRRFTRVYDDDSSVASAWSDPLSLRAADDTFTEVFVPAPSVRSFGDSRVGIHAHKQEPLALGARILAAPEKFGGIHGTRLIHVSCRYRIVNEMGREIEVLSEYGKGQPSCIGVDGRPTPFHFDGSSPIRFRPKEFGWGWSGRFNIRKKRKEVTLRLVHKLKGQVIIAEVEFIEAGKSGGNILVFREASHPPFRIENQTMQAIHFAQSSVLFGAERGQMPVSLDSTILPYHHADFAWDEPDEGRRYLAAEVADLGNTVHRRLIGRFKLDRAAPGNRVRLSDSSFFAQMIADGPTRVLRITDSSLPPLPSNEVATHVSNDIFKKSDTSAGPPSFVEFKLTHGIGVSVVDWLPQELMYIQFDEVMAERRVDGAQENLTFNISCVSVDNQMWVTPFPVLMRMGRRTRGTEKIRRRRNNAASVSWRRSLNTQSGLIMLDNFELSTEPIILCVDGYLSERLWNMARQAMGMRELIGGAPVGEGTRDSELRKVLKISEERHAVVLSDANQRYRDPFKNDGDDEAFLATAVNAAKLRMKPRSESIGMFRPSQSVAGKGTAGQSLLPKTRNKYYVGRWKISTMQAEISWSGPLPNVLINFPDIMRPALTFESLPVMMRPFSISHAYGTADDLVHDLKSHYFSIWRVFDFFVGLTFHPTFMIRACIYTWRESCASVFDSMSNALSDIEKSLTRLSEPESTPLLLEDQRAVTVYTSQAYQTVVGGSLLTVASLFHNSARVALAISNALRYGGSARHPGRLSVRARNPRLFAHVEGKELLVEYVEGENAGKAILSRVRMGRHLGEGHVFHCEGVHLQTDSLSQAVLDSTSLICMVTSERVFLLNGNRHANFCSVVWESTFLNLVEVEFDEFHESSFDLVKLWYFVDTAHAKGNTDDRLQRYAKAIVGDTDYGLDILLCKSILVPKESGAVLRSKIAAVHRRLDEATSWRG